jgi:hypothetical protein
VSYLNAFTDARGGNPQAAEGRLWMRALSTLGRIRLFYDYMRVHYRDAIAEVATDKDDLRQLSKVCADEESNSRIANIFSRYPGFKEMCNVNRIVVKRMAQFMKKPGPDITVVDTTNNYVPSSITGGDADEDFSHAFGTWKELSVLPYKISALNALTSVRPYFLGRWGLTSVPVYKDPDDGLGLFSYSTLYPQEYTEAIATAVTENLRFKSLGQDSTTIGRTAFWMGYFARQLDGSNEVPRFGQEYINNIREQNEFRISIVAVLVSLNKATDDPNRITNLTGEIYDLRTRETRKANEVYLLEDGKVIVRSPGKTFIYPLSTKMSFLNDHMGYVFAYQVEYQSDPQFDALEAHSVKKQLEQKHTDVINSCILGQKNGLSEFFTTQGYAVKKADGTRRFDGYLVYEGIALDPEKQNSFFTSVRDNFKKYYADAAFDGEHIPKPDPETCKEALAGQGLIISTAALINGYWLPELNDYFNKQ